MAHLQQPTTPQNGNTYGVCSLDASLCCPRYSHRNCLVLNLRIFYSESLPVLCSDSLVRLCTVAADMSDIYEAEPPEAAGSWDIFRRKSVRLHSKYLHSLKIIFCLMHSFSCIGALEMNCGKPYEAEESTTRGPPSACKVGMDESCVWRNRRCKYAGKWYFFRVWNNGFSPPLGRNLTGAHAHFHHSHTSNISYAEHISHLASLIKLSNTLFDIDI